MTKKKLSKEEETCSAVDILIDSSIKAAAIAEPEDVTEENVGKIISTRVRLRRRQTSCAQQSLNCMKKFFVYMLSYVGLTCIVVAYSILGGVIFVALESDNEELVQIKAAKVRGDYIKEFEKEVNMTLHLHKHYNQTYNYSEKIEKMLHEFQQQTFELVAKEGWTGVDVSDGDPKWTFAGGLLYAVTVITTIGYGFITPKTVAGQSITMLYALIGIPLTILCLSTIGKGMASLFRALYGRTLCVKCRQDFLLSVGARRASTVSNASLEKIELDQRNHNNGSVEVSPQHVDYIEGRHIHDHGEVPIVICLCLVVWYIIFGAIMFTIWETDWNLFTGSYFCFITLTTIGFGDIVPGFSHREWDDQVKQVACSLWLLIGLSTLAMCFDLMQVRSKNMANKFAGCVGLVKKQ